MRGTIDVEVEERVEAVFARLASPEAWLGTVDGVEEVRRVAGRGGVGTRWEAVVRAKGRAERLTAETTAHDPPGQLAYEVVASPATVRLDLSLSPRAGARATRAPAGTLVRCAWELERRGLARLVPRSTIEGWVERNSARIRKAVKAVLEGGEAPRRRARR